MRSGLLLEGRCRLSIGGGGSGTKIIVKESIH